VTSGTFEPTGAFYEYWGNPERKPSAMSVIPLHPQRRFEQRWAAQFGSRVFSAVPKTVRLKGSPVNIAPRVAKAKEKGKPAG
jgi:hypothetical protein